MFYLVCKSLDERNELIAFLKQNNVYSVFHYLSLHKSPYYHQKHDNRVLNNSDHYSDCLVRLPMFYELLDEQVELISELILNFYKLKINA